ncbi:hypothetical protein NPIL_431861 [Nephila pilipes]|uniref:Uncharacterized protein n=1 Tax=Nephila pilipes TaxID=299642 RepID=A0A8X6TMX2_NEPPI|nr:hypothetical protein NPIL_431861 [Nephila pilipes]
MCLSEDPSCWEDWYSVIYEFLAKGTTMGINRRKITPYFEESISQLRYICSVHLRREPTPFVAVRHRFSNDTPTTVLRIKERL